MRVPPPRPGEPPGELTPDGWQYVLPGVPTPGVRERIAHLLAQPWQPKQPQQPADFGLFDGAATRQMDLFRP